MQNGDSSEFHQFAKPGVRPTLPKRQAFVDFVLAQYVKEGVRNSTCKSWLPCLAPRYHSISDAKLELDQPEKIRDLFVGFQKYLYQPTA